MFSKTSEEKEKSVVREYVEAILIALVLALFIRSFVVQAFKIPSGSMEPTLLIGDHLLVNKFLFGVKNPFNSNTWIAVKNPQRGDIIVFKYPVNPKQDFIKRVVGIEGDTIKIVNKKLFVNDKLFKVEGAVHLDPTVLPPGVSQRDNMEEITVPQNSLFVMGDNRDNSHDSRFWKFVKLKDVKGKAFILYWSWNKEKFNVRLNRLFNLIN